MMSVIIRGWGFGTSRTSVKVNCGLGGQRKLEGRYSSPAHIDIRAAAPLKSCVFTSIRSELPTRKAGGIQITYSLLQAHPSFIAAHCSRVCGNRTTEFSSREFQHMMWLDAFKMTHKISRRASLFFRFISRSVNRRKTLLQN